MYQRLNKYSTFIWKTWFALVFVLLASVNSSYAEDKQIKTIKVGYIKAAQYLIIDEKAKLGIDYEILSNYAKSKNLNIRFVEYKTNKALFADLEKNNVDIAAGHLTSTASYAKREYRTAEYQKEDLVVVAYQLHGETTIKFPSETQNVYYANNLNLRNFNSLGRKLKLSPLDVKESSLVKSLGTGKVNYAILPKHTALAYIQLVPKFKIFPLDAYSNVYNLFYVKEQSLREDLTSYIETNRDSDQFSWIKYNNFNNLNTYYRQETNIFIRNMKTKFDQYKDLFIANASRMDWRLAMAVGYQESRWTPDAISPWGPSGFMMLTNKAAETLGVNNKLDATESIVAGTKLLMTFKQNLTKELTGYDRDMYAISVYNQGIAKIIDARTWLRKHNISDRSWVELAINLPKMSNETHKYGKINGKLTSEYIIGVKHWYFMIINYLHFYSQIG